MFKVQFSHNLHFSLNYSDNSLSYSIKPYPFDWDRTTFPADLSCADNWSTFFSSCLFLAVTLSSFVSMASSLRHMALLMLNRICCKMQTNKNSDFSILWWFWLLFFPFLHAPIPIFRELKLFSLLYYLSLFTETTPNEVVIIIKSWVACLHGQFSIHFIVSQCHSQPLRCWFFMSSVANFTWENCHTNPDWKFRTKKILDK